MSLPADLSGIFRQKQKSYKMVFILTLLDEMGETPREVSFTKVAERFRRFQAYREKNEMTADKPPASLGKSWQDTEPQQMRTVLDTPVNALSKILSVDFSKDRIRFRPEIAKQLGPSVLKDLRAEANRELTDYYQSTYLTSSVSLKDLFNQIINNYLSARTQPFSGHSLGTLMRHTIPQELQKLPFITEQYKVQGSVGMGNWATIPWIAIMDKRITETTQQGEYIVYLFSEDMKSVYLTLNQGVTVPLQQGRREGYELLKKRVEELRELLPLESMTKDDQIHLTSSGIGSDYQVSTVAYIRYDRGNLPDDEVLISDLRNLVKDYAYYVEHLISSSSLSDSQLEESGTDYTLTPAESLSQIKAFIEKHGFYFPPGLIENFYLSLKTKPFVILAGISGTGKTKLVELFAEAVGATEENGRFNLIPVRPDWSDPTDLLGYRDLSGVFKPGKLTKIFWEASQRSQRDKPYFVCLDEMNLARVEHYFSDLLSVMETRRWKDREIITDAILEEDEVQVLLEMQATSCLDDSEKGLANLSVLRIPQNVYLIGTVNMDETTHPFSKKVLDRAQTLEFNEIELNHFPKASMDSLANSDQGSKPLALLNSFLRSDYLLLKDVYRGNEALVERTTKRLMEINTILEAVHSNVGFRVRDTVCFYMVYNDQFDLLPEEEAFDLQLLQKILPRLQGSHASLKRSLLQLMALTTDQNLNLEEFMEDASPLYQGFQQGQVTPAARFPQSARKLGFMLRRLEEDGFTSFWIS